MLDNKTIQANLVGLLTNRNDSGPLWSTESEDLDCTFVSWQDGQGVVAHVNSEVDVVMIVLFGSGKATVGDEAIELSRGQVVLVPKGAHRSIHAVGDGLAYLNVHKRRKRLIPGNPDDRPPASRTTVAV